MPVELYLKVMALVGSYSVKTKRKLLNNCDTYTVVHLLSLAFINEQGLAAHFCTLVHLWHIFRPDLRKVEASPPMHSLGRPATLAAASSSSEQIRFYSTINVPGGSRRTLTLKYTKRSSSQFLFRKS